LAQLGKADPATAGLLRAMSRMTITPTILHAGVKSNSIPASAVLKCDSRTLPGQDADYVKREVEATLRGIDGVTVDVEVWARSTQSPHGTPFTDALGRALRLVVGKEDLKLVPTLTTGFTDSQFVRPLGVQAYGFSPIHPDGDTARSGVHGVDENLEVDALLVRTKVFLAVAYMTAVDGLVAAQ
jgi:acetylornithine deacetylase/succinyl-diaminopimelate desuccinylase-like protein